MFRNYKSGAHVHPLHDKKALLSQRWPPDAPYRPI